MAAKFICLEGIDGCGKNTQIRLLRERLLPVPVKVLHFPGYTEFGKKVRDLILETPTIEDLPRQILQWADFVQTYNTSFHEEGTYILDRLPHYSSIAYGAASGVDVETLLQLRKILGQFTPDITFIIDVPAEVGASRMKRRGRLNIIEQRGIQFLKKVRNFYLDLPNLYPQEKPIYFIDGNREAQEVHEDIFKLIMQHEKNGR